MITQVEILTASPIVEGFIDEAHGAVPDLYAVRNEHEEIYNHMRRVAVYVGDALSNSGVDSRTIRTGVFGAILHDIVKADVIEARSVGDERVVWDESTRLYIRNRHTRDGMDFIGQAAAKTSKYTTILDDSASISRYHHTPPPVDYYTSLPTREAYRWGHTHLLQVADRLDALTTRPYVAQREGKLTVYEALDLALDGLEPVAIIGSHHIDLRESLGSLVRNAVA